MQIAQQKRWLGGLLACLLCLAFSTSTTFGHDGPDPVVHWKFTPDAIQDGQLNARLGPAARMLGNTRFLSDPHGTSLVFDGQQTACIVADDSSKVRSFLPKKALTVAAWVAVNEGEHYGGVVSVVQDNGDAEKGWVLGYNEDVFTFGLASQGADDGNGHMTYLTGKTPHEPGKLFHVVGVYDGVTMQLYVNGRLEAESKTQSGEILYPESTPFVLGAYQDNNEHFLLNGMLRDVAVYDLAAKSAWVRHEYEQNERLTTISFQPRAGELDFVVRPFLQYGTETGMTVVWQTTGVCTAELSWGEDDTCSNVIESKAEGVFHEVRIEGLEANTQYFYKVRCQQDDDEIHSSVSTFQTAVPRGLPISFAVISDTQDSGPVASTLSELAWAQRPHFVMHSGDLVGRGKKDSDWVEEFFPAMMPLISRVPLFPVLGNHEDDARNYYDYMALPEPEYYYTFSYGDADFFMIDSNRNVDPGSEQYKWLDESLSKSKATWKFVCHHHPPYSSDENDYGNLWKQNKSTRGDLRIRQLTELYEKHHVDIVWTGHIHSYERTWPIRENQAVEQGGTIYMITGGGGGSLETPGPYRPFFQNNVRRAHHYTMVHINGGTLELKTYSLEDKLFDYTKIEKQK